MRPEPIVVLVTCGSEEEALKIANALVEGHLAACANLVSPILSIYRWEGKIWDEKEWLLIIKTQKQINALKQTIKELEAEKIKLSKEIELLRENPLAIEDKAREKLWLMKKNEKVIVLVKEKEEAKRE